MDSIPFGPADFYYRADEEYLRDPVAATALAELQAETRFRRLGLRHDFYLNGSAAESSPPKNDDEPGTTEVGSLSEASSASQLVSSGEVAHPGDGQEASGEQSSADSQLARGSRKRKNKKKAPHMNPSSYPSISRSFTGTWALRACYGVASLQTPGTEAVANRTSAGNNVSRGLEAISVLQLWDGERMQKTCASRGKGIREPTTPVQRRSERINSGDEQEEYSDVEDQKQKQQLLHQPASVLPGSSSSSGNLWAQLQVMSSGDAGRGAAADASNGAAGVHLVASRMAQHEMADQTAMAGNEHEPAPPPTWTPFVADDDVGAQQQYWSCQIADAEADALRDRQGHESGATAGPVVHLSAATADRLHREADESAVVQDELLHFTAFGDHLVNACVCDEHQVLYLVDPSENSRSRWYLDTPAVAEKIEELKMSRDENQRHRQKKGKGIRAAKEQHADVVHAETAGGRRSVASSGKSLSATAAQLQAIQAERSSLGNNEREKERLSQTAWCSGSGDGKTAVMLKLLDKNHVLRTSRNGHQFQIYERLVKLPGTISSGSAPASQRPRRGVRPNHAAFVSVAALEAAAACPRRPSRGDEVVLGVVPASSEEVSQQQEPKQGDGFDYAGVGTNEEQHYESAGTLSGGEVEEADRDGSEDGGRTLLWPHTQFQQSAADLLASLSHEPQSADRRGPEPDGQTAQMLLQPASIFNALNGGGVVRLPSQERAAAVRKNCNVPARFLYQTLTGHSAAGCEHTWTSTSAEAHHDGGMDGRATAVEQARDARIEELDAFVYNVVTSIVEGRGGQREAHHEHGDAPSGEPDAERAEGAGSSGGITGIGTTARGPLEDEASAEHRRAEGQNPRASQEAAMMFSERSFAEVLRAQRDGDEGYGDILDPVFCGKCFEVVAATRNLIQRDRRELEREPDEDSSRRSGSKRKIRIPQAQRQAQQQNSQLAAKKGGKVGSCKVYKKPHQHDGGGNCAGCAGCGTPGFGAHYAPQGGLPPEQLLAQQCYEMDGEDDEVIGEVDSVSCSRTKSSTERQLRMQERKHKWIEEQRRFAAESARDAAAERARNAKMIQTGEVAGVSCAEMDEKVKIAARSGGDQIQNYIRADVVKQRGPKIVAEESSRSQKTDVIQWPERDLLKEVRQVLKV
eukprot:g317.t1